MSRDAWVTAINAVSNASRTSVSAADLVTILSTGDGPGDVVRALFGDCSFETLDRLGAARGLSRADVRAAYGRARRLHAAANAELDEKGEPW